MFLNGVLYCLPRLPILQGGTFTFITPTLAILALPKWKCPEVAANVHLNATAESASLTDPEEVWKVRMREVQPVTYHCIYKLSTSQKCFPALVMEAPRLAHLKGP